MYWAQGLHQKVMRNQHYCLFLYILTNSSHMGLCYLVRLWSKWGLTMAKNIILQFLGNVNMFGHLLFYEQNSQTTTKAPLNDWIRNRIMETQNVPLVHSSFTVWLHIVSINKDLHWRNPYTTENQIVSRVILYRI